MSIHSLFFLLLILVIPVSNVYADTVATAYLLPEGETAIANDEVILDNDTELDLSENVATVTKTTQTIGGIEINLTRQVKFVATQGDVITLSNTQLTNVVVQIPDETIVLAPAIWDNTIQPPKQIATSRTVAAGFQTPTTSISVGSPDVVLVFDKSVTILLEGTTGQTAYMLPRTDNWILISTCTGTFASPDDPPANGECSITDGIDTKILTFHFTEFAGLSTTTTSITTSTSTSSTVDSGRINVGPTSGPGSSGSREGGGSSIIAFYPPTTVNVIPSWIHNVVVWWNEGVITEGDFKNIMTHLLDKDIIPTDTPMQAKPLIDLAPSMKHLFSMWASDKIPESSIIDLIHHYRDMGVW